jgi:hypothetical protein
LRYCAKFVIFNDINPPGMVKTYVIRRGAHFASGLHFRPFLCRTSMHFRARFDAGCIYVPQQEPGQINKLFGISWGRHHHCSARIGWRSDGRRIELLSYVYAASGKRQSRSLGFVDPGIWFLCAIERYDRDLAVAVRGMGIHHFVLDRPRIWGYQLYPYFGGTDTAPQRIQIQVEIVDRKAAAKPPQHDLPDRPRPHTTK